jgi:peptidoglycan/LPS O-acetylase OafA/YrhL
VLTGTAAFASRPIEYLTFTQTWGLPLPVGPLRPTWTLASEMVFYAAVPLLARYRLLGYALAVPSFLLWNVAPELPPSMLWAFVLGMAATRVPLGATPALLIAAAYVPLGFATGSAVLTALGAAAAVRAAVVRPRTSIPAIALVADMTYAFYLWHLAVLVWLGLTGWVLAVSALVVLVPIAAGSLFFVERPVLRKFGRVHRPEIGPAIQPLPAG